MNFCGGFAFLERQKRITLDCVDHYLDLLFYHRHLRRLVAINLKLEEFKAGDKGQMELYLRWLERYERKEGEETPIGLILCAGKLQEQLNCWIWSRAGFASLLLDGGSPEETTRTQTPSGHGIARARLGNKIESAKEKSGTRPRRRKK